MNRQKLYRRFTGVAAMLALTLVMWGGSAMAATPTLTTPTTTNLGTNQVTLNLTSSATGTGYFTLLSGSNAACGTGDQVKLGQTAGGVTAPYHGSLPLTATVAGLYTLHNLPQTTAFTVCYTADDGTNLQTTPVAANVTTTTMTAGVTPAWSIVGSAGFSAGYTPSTSLSFAPDGAPYVAYQDGVNGSKASVMKYTGSAWTLVGSAGFSVNQANYPSLAFAPDGAPYVAYQDDNTGEVIVMKYTGSAWTLVGSAGSSSKAASLSFAPDGTPYVAYVDKKNHGEATVMKYTGSVWTLVGSAAVSAGGANYPSLAFAPDGAPYVAYQDGGNNSKASVMKYTGSVWTLVGSAGFSAGMPYSVSLSFAPDGAPYVAYQDWDDIDNKATVMKYDGTAWTLVGSAGFSAGRADSTSLAFAPDGAPYVSYMDYTTVNQKASVMRLGLGSSTAVSSGSNPATVGASITYTGTVTPSAATGTVSFNADGTTLGTRALSGGSATYNTTALTVGSHSITAVYVGAGSYYGSNSSTLTQTVNKASQTITFANPGTQTYGTTSPLTATASSLLTPTFSSITTGVCTITTGGLLTFVTPGSCTINADQAGNDSYSAAPQVPQTFTVNKGTPIVMVTAGTYTYSGSAQGPGAGQTTTGGSTGTLSFSYVGVSGTTYGPLTTAPNNAGSYTVTATVTTDSNYNAASSSATAFSIGMGTPTASVGNSPQNYTGSAQSATVTCLGGGTAGNITTGGSTTQTNAGSYAVVADCDASTNYNAATGLAAGNFVLSKITPLVTVTPGTYTYSGSPQGPGVGQTTTGGSTGALTLSYAGTGSTNYLASETKPTSAGTYTVTATAATDINYTAVSSSATAFSISKATPVVTVTPGTYTYTGSAQGPGATETTEGSSTGALTFSYLGTGSTTYTASATKPTTAGTYNVTATAATDANYTAASSSAMAFSIDKATPSITSWPTALTITYGRTLADSSLTGGVSSPAGNFTFTTPTTAPNAGTNSQNVTFTPTDTADYSTVSGAVNVTVNKADPTIVFNSLSVTVGGSGTVSATGGSGSFTYSATSTADCSVSGANVTGMKVGAGNCIIKADQIESANYNAGTLTQSFSISQGNQTITFAPSRTLVVGGNSTVSASATSGLVVTYATTTSDVCILNGVNNSTLTGVKGGTCTITAAQPGNVNFTAASPTTQSFTVGLGNQTITFGSAPNLEAQGTATVTATGGTSGNPVVFSSLTLTTCSASGTNGSTVTGLLPGACTVAANQAGVDGYYNAAQQTTQNLIVTPQSQVSVVIQTTPSGLNFTVTDTDGTNSYVAPHLFNWVPGSAHTVTATSTQPGISGVRYLFNNWSDGGSMTHTVTAPVASATYTAAFATQYQLTTTTDGHGAAIPAQQWYNAGEYATILATPASGYVFSTWTLTGGSGVITNPAAVTTSVAMNGPTGVNGAMLLLAPANLSATIVTGGKSGIIGGIRSWPISIQNTGSAVVDGVTLNSVTLSTSGACKPTVTTDSLLPLAYGVVAGPGVVTQNVQVNFAKCPLLTKFTVTVRYGASGGVTGSNSFTGVTQ